MEHRIEHDSMGEVKVPAEKYWGAQTQRSHENFPIGVGIETMPREITHAFGILKQAAARANHALKPEKMTGAKCRVIEQAAAEVASGALDVRASDINDTLKLSAASAIAGLVSDGELSADYIPPKAFDPRVKDAVARATAEAARASGVARI